VEDLGGGRLVENIGGGLVEDLGGGLVENIGGGLVEYHGGGLVEDHGGGLVEDHGGGLVEDFGGDLVEDLGGGLVEDLGGGLVEDLGGGDQFVEHVVRTAPCGCNIFPDIPCKHKIMRKALQHKSIWFSREIRRKKHDDSIVLPILLSKIYLSKAKINASCQSREIDLLMVGDQLLMWRTGV